eukprot:TRINITY_DN9369_c0_g1_i2.p1 TRINITY_DN9369_c0_g1~~TRINITY_DN9369_c0_g1_i2.p1  ORF type:complete len:222 (+),score=40.79 TRINITY_DN9369_c0_g1_i2:99-668(+)
MSKRVLVPVANGSEDIETVTIVDVLRRGGVDVVLASVEDDATIIAARKTKIIADALLRDVADQSFDAVALPGGMPGAERLRDSDVLSSLLKRHHASNGVCAAVCASPAVVFVPLGIIGSKNATCHPNFEDKMPSKAHIHDRVVVDGNLITSRGPGTSLEFSLKILEVLCGKEAADKVAAPMLLPPGLGY